MNHHTRVCVDLRAYERNIRFFLTQLRAGCGLCAVVKADAYGHGLRRLAPAAVRAGASVLGITENSEIETIRGHGIDVPVWRLRPALPDEAREAAVHGVHEVVGSLPSAQSLSRIGEASGKPLPVFLKLDTGIGRMGFVLSHHRREIEETLNLPGIAIQGAMTHFPCADEDDVSITEAQLVRFERELEELFPECPASFIVHTANSAATLRFPQSHRSMVRVGIASYGLAPANGMALPGELQPVMSWKTAVAQVREVPAGATVGYGMTYTAETARRIATLPIGYADSYSRAFSNNAEVLIQGRRCPVVGRVSMNMATADVTHVPEVQPGDEAVLLGRQGEEEIRMEELAARAGTISYELACTIGLCNQNRREYIGDDA